MEDRDIMEKELLNIKGVCDLYMHGTIESSTAEVHAAFKDALDAWENGNYIKGIIYSIYLKKIDLLDKYFDSIPISKVQLIVDKIPFGLVSPL